MFPNFRYIIFNKKEVLLALLDINDMELRNIVRVIKLSYIILKSASSLVRHITAKGGESQENKHKMIRF